MAEERIRIILKEIHHWKQNRLLPEVYCDFLIALYTNGEGIEGDVKTKEKTPVSIYIYLLFLVSSLLFSFCVIYIITFPTFMTLCSLFLFWFVSILSFVMIWKKHKYTGYYALSLMMLLLLTLLNSVYVGTTLSDSPFIINSVIIINFVAWFVISVLIRFKWLMFISFLGLIFTFFYIVL